MTLLTYTSFQEVRAVLGVSATELTDATLMQPMWGTTVVLALEDVVLEIPATYDAVASLPVKTADQKRFTALVELFAPYAIAKQALTSLPLFAVQSLTDGRAGFQRSSNATIYDDLRSDVQAAMADIQARLKACYYRMTGLSDTTTANVMPVLTVASPRGLDPVTNL